MPYLSGANRIWYKSGKLRRSLVMSLELHEQSPPLDLSLLDLQGVSELLAPSSIPEEYFLLGDDECARAKRSIGALLNVVFEVAPEPGAFRHDSPVSPTLYDQHVLAVDSVPGPVVDDRDAGPPLDPVANDGGDAGICADVGRFDVSVLLSPGSSTSTGGSNPQTPVRPSPGNGWQRKLPRSFARRALADDPEFANESNGDAPPASTTGVTRRRPSEIAAETASEKANRIRRQRRMQQVRKMDRAKRLRLFVMYVVAHAPEIAVRYQEEQGVWIEDVL